MRESGLFALFGFLGVIIIPILIVGLQYRYYPPTETPRLPPPTQNEGTKNEVITSTPAADSLPPVSSPLTPPKTPDIDKKPFVEPKISRNPNIGILKESRIFSDRLTSKNPERTYFFTIDKSSNVSLYLDQVTNQVGMWLYVDTNGNKIIDSGEQIDSTSAYSNSTGTISRTLGPDNYIATVKFQGSNTDYNFQIVNDTNDATNVKSLQERKTFTDTLSLTRKNRQKYYLFSLESTSSVNIILDQVTNQVGIWLYVDTNGNGVIDPGEQIDSASAYINSAGTIQKNLGKDDYILQVRETGGNTKYTLTMTSQ
ncbi:MULTISPECIES: hypothetical protein [unclassified Tychonema]|uniref:hypothetical protein n=1 Tax=unclassified Tychonema TaxID=2642144 RepID=UPI001882085E|nr:MULTISPECIES: hypothetical protein [unclassified Tychonema]MBE9131916.1 hypothetical protein [Tychonema sp. LEGE 07196]MBE9162570.1 hypothetical protein [Tychonema sp. LEGE 06208]